MSDYNLTFVKGKHENMGFKLFTLSVIKALEYILLSIPKEEKKDYECVINHAGFKITIEKEEDY